jgi:hypothetical protein
METLTCFIQWAEQYLSEEKADLAHSRGVSFKNMMLRIPGSISSKNGGGSKCYRSGTVKNHSVFGSTLLTLQKDSFSK